MTVKHIELPNIGKVTLQKRRGNRSLRISISSRGIVKITLPPWAPYKLAVEFAFSKRDWIIKNRPDIAPIVHQTRVGKAHHLVFVPTLHLQIPRTQVKGNQVIVSLPPGVLHTDPKIQQLANTAAVRALKAEAGQLLPPRLEQLAQQYGFSYKSVVIKRLSSRWGSCDRQMNIALNCYLMQLPWHLIDYVLIHELTHTRVMAHGPKFWAELGQYVPNLQAVRKEIRASRPALNI